MIFRLYLFLLAGAANPAAADDIDSLWSRLRVSYLGVAGADASGFLSSLRTDGSWADIDYADRSTTAWKPIAHLKRLRSMGVAYSMPGNSEHQSGAVFAGIERGLGFWFTRKPTSTNWWQNDIGQQRELGPILVVLRNELEPAILATGASYLKSPGMTGQNLVWLATETIQRGCIKRQVNDVISGLDAIKSVTVITASEGIQQDYSFHQHGPQLYSAGYGLDFMNDVSFWAFMARGLSFAFPKDKIDVLSGYLLHGDRWMVRGKMMDYSAKGRDISRVGQSMHATHLVSPCERLVALDAPNSSSYTALKAHILSGAPDPLSGNKHFWRSDFTAHHREAFYISAKMCSNRTNGTESINRENLHGYWLPFGLTYIFRRGDEYADIFPVWDWAGLPGVTSPAMVKFAETVTQSGSFVGGVSDGTYGVSAMALIKDSTLAKKAWFFFDKEVVALGAGIASTQSHAVNTTINQCLAKGEVYIDNVRIAGGAQGLAAPFRVYHDSIGYQVLEGPPGSIVAASRSGTWSTINEAQNNTAIITKDVFTCRLYHGVKPSGQTYAYTIVPGISRSAFEAYCAVKTIEVRENSDTLQAIWHLTQGFGGAVFHAAGSVKMTPDIALDVDQPCLVLLRQGDSPTLSVANPRNAALTVKVGLTRKALRKVFTFTLPGGSTAGSTRTQQLDQQVGISMGSGKAAIAPVHFPRLLTGGDSRLSRLPNQSGATFLDISGRIVLPRNIGKD